ncbi:MAG: alpha/beta hydrolase-fold protein [Actinomycetota bacterium]
MSPDELLHLIAEIEGLSDADRPAALDRLRDQPALATAEPASALRAAQLFSLSGEPSDLPVVVELAGRAHDAGLVGAGLVFAEAADKLCLFSGRPQRYGTVMVEHQGDVVQPPVDPSITDAQRAELGVPSMAELRERMAAVTRQLATERATKPGFLPPGERFCRVWTDPDPEELRTRMAAEGGSAWADGDVITFVTESPVPVVVAPVFPIESWDAGEGLQVLSLRVDRAAEAVITYTFTPTTGGGAMNFRRGSHDGRFRGVDAPPELDSSDPLLGSSFEHAIESDALGGPRTVTVYKPPGHSPGDDTPVIYATDGNMFAPYARRLDAAIQSGLCPPVVVVAAHSAPMNQIEGNQRALEYLQGFDDARFDAHQRFFIVELAAWAETELGVATTPERRGVFGCSDGAGHALMTARLHPAKFGHAFAFSTGMPPDPSTTWDAATHPMVHLCAGTLEGGFFQATEAWAGFLGLQDAPVHFTERVAGHDLIQWCEELPRAVDRAWGTADGATPEGSG